MTRSLHRATRSAQRASSTHLVGLAKVGTTAVYSPNAIIFRQAQEADGIYYIEEGLVKIDVASRQGKRAVVALLARDTFFGEDCLVGQSARSATAWERSSDWSSGSWSCASRPRRARERRLRALPNSISTRRSRRR